MSLKSRYETFYYNDFPYFNKVGIIISVYLINTFRRFYNLLCITFINQVGVEVIGSLLL